jgi:endoglucanase
LLTVQGDAAKNRHIVNLRFEGLEFSHCAAPQFPSGYAGIQAGFHESRSGETDGSRRNRMPAAIVLDTAAGCHLVDCRVSHVGGTAISLEGKCEGNRLVGNEIFDAGGNGIMIGEPSTSVESLATNNVVANNHVHECGRLFHGSVGIWLGITADTTVSHNEIDHLPYTGVSVGWMWNTSPTPCQRNMIAYNHIHHVMQMLSDGGGIYTLGRQPGTVLRGNLIHDVQLNAGRAESNGLFIDEGSSELLIEQNTIFRIARSPIRFHKAVGNVVRENVLVTSGETPPFRFNATDAKSMTYEANVMPDAETWSPPTPHESQAGLEPAYVRKLLSSQDAFYYNELLGRGVNLGNALEAPREGAWGLELKAEYFEQIKQAGFDSVRIPIRWSAHAQAAAPYEIEESFFQRVDWAIDQALKRGFVAVINMHHYEEIFQHPAEHRERFLSLWAQISRRYRTQSDRLYFELLNEPHDNLSNATWNTLLRDALHVVRASNRDRIVIVGPGRWNNISQLSQLELPADDRRLIVTFHYYSPFHFTHQGASWVKNSDRWLGTVWHGSAAERQAISDDLNQAARWAEQVNRPLYLGEFGAYSKADMESRARWARQVREEAERRGISWAYWELAAGFGAWDRDKNAWRSELLSALIQDGSE